VTTWVLKEVFQQLFYARVPLEGIILSQHDRAGKNAASRQRGGSGARHLQGAERLRARPVPGIAFLRWQTDEKRPRIFPP